MMMFLRLSASALRTGTTRLRNSPLGTLKHPLCSCTEAVTHWSISKPCCASCPSTPWPLRSSISNTWISSGLKMLTAWSFHTSSMPSNTTLLATPMNVMAYSKLQASPSPMQIRQGSEPAAEVHQGMNEALPASTVQ